MALLSACISKLLPLTLVFTDPQAILSEVTEILILGIIDLHLIPSQYPLPFKAHDVGTKAAGARVV